MLGNHIRGRHQKILSWHWQAIFFDLKGIYLCLCFPFLQCLYYRLFYEWDSGRSAKCVSTAIILSIWRIWLLIHSQTSLVQNRGEYGIFRHRLRGGTIMFKLNRPFYDSWKGRELFVIHKLLKFIICVLNSNKELHFKLRMMG